MYSQYCSTCRSPLHCQVVEVPPPAVGKVVDTTGAGDAFLGGLIVGESLLSDTESYGL